MTRRHNVGIAMWIKNINIKPPRHRLGVKPPARLTPVFRPLDGQVGRARGGIGTRAMGGIKGGLLSCILFLNPAHAEQNWQTYLKKTTGDQYKCYLWLINKESHGRPDARNGSHYGLWQVRNEKIGTSSPNTQINYMKKYMEHRYNGKCRLAKAHHMKHNWW